MRKLFLLLFLIIAVIVHARQISEDEATSIASEFLNSATVKQASAKVGVCRAKARDAANADAAPFYVYNADDNKGFVIVSGDDRAQRILGYSDKGSFDFNNLPPQLDAMLEQYEKQLSSIPDCIPAHSSWSVQANVGSSEERVLLETVNWGQGAPYNTKCPIIDGIQAPTGCVATAMAIVMKYHNWPERYDWDSMLISDAQSNGINSIAELMSDIGKSVEMKYGIDESSTNSEQVRYALVEDFNFSNSLNQLFLKYLDFEMLLPSACIQIIKNQIDKSQPCLFSGTTPDGKGHMFVCDGYDGDLIHINWGWDGAFNGYYDLNISNDREMIYSDSQLLLSEIQKGNDNYSRVFIDSSVNYDARVGYGLNIRNKDIKAGETIQFVVSSLGAPLDFCGDITLALVDENDNIKELLDGDTPLVYRIDNEERTRCSYNDKFHRFYWDSRWRNYYFKNDPSERDCVCVVSKEDGSSEWKIVPGTITASNKVSAHGNTPKTIHINIVNEDGVRIGMDNVLDEENNILSGQVFGISALSTDGFPSLNLSGYQTLYVCPASGVEGTTGEYFADVVLSAFGVPEITIVATIQKFSDLKKIEVHLDDYNTLADKLEDVSPAEIGEIIISGKLSSQDLEWLSATALNILKLDIGNTDLENITKLPLWLQTLELPKNMKQIYPYAFSSKPLLNTLIVPRNADFIHENAFYQSGQLMNVISLSETPPSADQNAFSEFCNLRSTTINNYYPILYVPKGSLKRYEEASGWKDFKLIVECDTSNVKFDIIEHDGFKLNRVSDYARILNFPYDEERLTIPDFFEINSKKYQSLTLECREEDRYGLEADIKLKSLTVSGNIHAICNGCFSGCDNLKSIYILEGVEEIESAFRSNNIEEIYLPSSLRLCHIRAFYGSNHIRHIGYNAMTPAKTYGEEWENAFENEVYENAMLYVPQEAIPIFKETEPWRNFKSIQNYFGYLVSSISLTPVTVTGKEGEQIHINATVFPEDVTDKTILWSSSDESVATVDESGLISLLRKGTVVITASATDGSGVSAECVVVVTDEAGIESIQTDKNTYVKIFNLSGILVYEGIYSEANLEADYYIVVCDGKNVKVKIE